MDKPFKNTDFFLISILLNDNCLTRQVVQGSK